MVHGVREDKALYALQELRLECFEYDRGAKATRRMSQDGKRFRGAALSFRCSRGYEVLPDIVAVGDHRAAMRD